MKRFVARALIVAAAIIGIVFAQVVPASATASGKLNSNLAALWTAVLETPRAQNSFGTGGAAFACWDLDHSTVSPFAPTSVASCEVKPGTKIFVVGSSVECSSFEGNGTTDDELRTCASEGDAQQAPTLTVDGRSVTLSEAQTPLLNLVLPADNIFGLPAGTAGQSVGHGWVTLLNPLTPGTHTIVIGGTITTQIVVTPGL
jgi:hypothetical protein